MALQPALLGLRFELLRVSHAIGKAPLAAFKQFVAQRINQVLDASPSPEETVVAVYGVGSLFGFVRISEVIPLVEAHIRGRLLVLFPGRVRAEQLPHA